MRREWWLAGVLVLLAAAFVGAYDDKDDKDDKDKDKQKQNEPIKGEVRKVDAEKGVLVLRIRDKDEEFKIPADAKITIAVAGRVKEAENGLKDNWFLSADKAAGTGRFTVELTKNKDARITKVHLKTPTGKE